MLGRAALLLTVLLECALQDVGSVETSHPCASGVVQNQSQYAVIRDPYSPNIFRSIQSFCPSRGWLQETTKEYTDCYEKTLLNIPPFHVDLNKLEGCETDGAGTLCTQCNDCVNPFKLHVGSLGLEEFQLDSRKGEIHVTLASEVTWADPRLWQTAVSDIKKVWHPIVHVAVHSLNETREELTYEKEDRLEETHTSSAQLLAPVYDEATDSFDTKTSFVSCLDMDPPPSCSIQDLDSCGVTQRLTQTIVVKTPHTLYDRYPFDRHIIRIQLSFTDPYTFIPESMADEWGLAKPVDVDWGYNATGTPAEFENSDGTKSYAPMSMIKSLALLSVPQFTHRTTVKLTSAHELLITLDLSRQSSGILFRSGLPMIFLTFVTTLVPTLGTEQFHPRNIVCIIGMLTAVTLNNGAHMAAPASGQSTWFDAIFLVSVFFAFCALMENFVILWMKQLNVDAVRNIVDRFMMYTFPGFYVSSLILVTVVQLRDRSAVAARALAALPLIVNTLFAIRCLILLWREELSRRAAVSDDPEAAQPIMGTAESVDPTERKENAGVTGLGTTAAGQVF
mmetsp:Transcript_57768/g.118219  ORF Transcript_57768/g.118219 Transcript_57768/m.118219 type:complete len:563 (+) Transcript_57768:50-1738(+)|eukprot:CAMPEP_0181288772 /NCGR_PEP_ID=MMETSP1101-20121128/522_1 /TAXON_ID=46948 /ORGANISM="Rhodomonas abbreviata, Strain Caron Lab Isolate" /LENGTH=562 /DNA_ID=CAMNT_0023392939 /DNA_START=82 /DNA_END=1770 /DNA_ORIENTATION=+